MDCENHTAGTEHMDSEEKVAEDFITLFLVEKDKHIGFSLKQATFTIEDAVYWAEHIGADNSSTEVF